MPAKSPNPKKAKAKPVAASEEVITDAQLRASVEQTNAALRQLFARDAETKAEQAKRDAEMKAEQAKRDAEQAKRDAEHRAEQAKRDAEQAKRDAEHRAEQAKRDAERDAWMKRLGESDEKTRKRIEAAEKARGRAAEAQFRKVLPGLLAGKGMPVDHVEPRALKKEDREYDFIARNGRMNFVGEIKVRFRAKDLAQLTRLLVKFREDYPDKAGDRPIYGVVCGMTVDEDAANIARKEGLLVVDGRTEANLRMPARIRDYARWNADANNG